ncbi:MAG: Long-chain-fatty-acid--CoA ligase [Bacteroidetes bacterium]|nr:Long-chain-fatty-acid--CoA ligase [Bacteroidota bacterium]
MNQESFIANIEESLKNHWDYPALSDYKAEPKYYSFVAKQIAKAHIFFEECGIKKGDKIALCGRNSSNWAVSFFSIITYGAVAVPILHEFKPEAVHHLVNHSEAKLLFVGDVVWESLDEKKMDGLNGIILLTDFSLVSSCNSCKKAYQRIEEKFRKRYPKGFRRENVKYERENINDLAIINYTSGTTSLSKGVMLSYKAVNSNLLFATEELPEMTVGMNIISMLPMAHMYGMAFEIIFEFMVGMHIHFLTRVPSPKIIAEAFESVKPDLIIAVPLIVEKIYKSKIKPMIDKTLIKILLNTPIIDSIIKNKILSSINTAFGGKFNQIIIGGAALNQEVEAFFKNLGLRYTIGYGMTECSPIITYSNWKTFRQGSCGKVVTRMQIKIDSPDSENIVGEIMVKGDHVMMGYYKNPEATSAVLSEDGWFRTGDLGLIDKDGYLFIKGRIKNMILGSSGQNIYPEEIEDKLNSMEYVMESIVLEQEGKLVAMVYLNQDMLDKEGIDIVRSKSIIRKIKEELNKELPAYSQISYIYLQEEEFEKTPKRSIKRYLYTSIIPSKKPIE